MSVNERPDNPNSAKRGYHSPKRRQQVEATRRRILVAAERLFALHGYAAVTMESIAREAQVSLATVYLHFAGRALMVGALAEEIATAPELSVERVEQAGQSADPVERLRTGAHIMRELNERAWLVTDILRSQRGSDPDLERLWLLWQVRHLDAMHRASAALAAQEGLRPGLSVDTAADELYVLTGTEFYRALVLERGWSPEQYEQWLFDIARRELLPPSN